MSTFRSDVAVLRTFATLCVLFYHLDISPGGLVGVDLFLPISGYLYVNVLGKENFITYVMKRIKRLIPQLLLLLIVGYVIGPWILFPREYLNLAKNSITSLTFISNIRYWLYSGYFDEASSSNLLLHTWSLSLEIQFAIFATFLFKLRREWLFTLCGLSFALMVLIPDRQFVFYMLPTRLWEFLLGTVLFTKPFKFPKILCGLGFTLILGSTLIHNFSEGWPSSLTLLPVLGTCLVLNSKVTLKYCACINDLSYYLYLWHWPMIVLATSFHYDSKLILTLCIFVVSYLAKKFNDYITLSNDRRSHISSVGTHAITRS